MNLIQLLVDNPLLLLLSVAAIGYPLGRLKIGGFSLGVAAVLFSGLAIGALHPNLKLPEFVYQFGLVLFVYTIGLSSGRSFMASFKRKGLRDNLFALSLLVVATLLAAIASSVLRLKPGLGAGLFAGSLTNTPALAGVLDYLKVYAEQTGISNLALDQLLADPVVAYSITYPMGVIGTLLSIALAQRLWKINYTAEAEAQRSAGAYLAFPKIGNRTVQVTQPQAVRIPVETLCHEQKWDVAFGRIKHFNQLAVISGKTLFNLGDLVTVVGAPRELDRVAAYLGQASRENLEFSRKDFDYRRVFISNPAIAGFTLGALNLPQRFGAVVTRVRRGDVEFVPHGDTMLELGDRVRVLTQRGNIDNVSVLFGDSYRAVSEIDVLSFSLGLALGLVVGLLPLPLPGGITIKLGLAGGPLVVALLLGALERTGSIVWSLPYSANVTLRQVGLILFLAGIGTRAGYAFVTTLTQGSGLAIFLAGAAFTVVVALLTLWVGYKLLKIPMGILIGMLAALQTQPAVLGFALEQTGDERPNIGYTAVYPIATVAKIILAQVLLVYLLRS